MIDILRIAVRVVILSLLLERAMLYWIAVRRHDMALAGVNFISLVGIAIAAAYIFSR